MNSLKQIIICLGTLGAAAAISYAIMPLWGFVISTAVLVCHEFGHYVAGKTIGAKTYLPFFIPLGIFLVGVTKITDVPDNFKAFVAASGPLAGLLTALILFFIVLILGIQPAIIFCGTAIVFELYSLSFGSDGRRFKKAKGQHGFSLPFRNRYSSKTEVA